MDIKCSVYIATSVDGFIADAHGGIGWLNQPEYASSEHIGTSFQEFISTVDALVMGRRTFETVLSFGEWPYEGTPAVVLSSSGGEIPQRLHGKVHFDSGEPEAIAARLASEGRQHAYIEGGVTIQRFLRSKLITELIITRIPILLGGGVPLFGSLGVRHPLLLVENVVFNNGLVQDRYGVEEERRSINGQVEVF